MKVLILALAFTIASAFEYTAEWEMWKREHGKQYNNDKEENMRHTIFESNLKYVETHNGNSDRWFDMGLNEYSDMENAEFVRAFNGYRAPEKISNNTRIFDGSGVTDPADSVDWRKKGYVTGVKNQGQCGSCWAFSTTGSLEGQHFKKTGKLVSLSEQNLVDCSTAEGNHGCQGGLMDQGFEYIKKNGGIDTEESYPYKAENGHCHYDASNSGATVTGYTDIKSEDCDDLKKAVATVGPISVAMDASHMSFQLYHSGVYDPFFCSKTKLDHGVLIVGYDTVDGKEVWIVKNSWGPSWGMKGYFYIPIANDKCGLCTQASYPLV